MTQYDETFTVPVAFQPTRPDATLGELFSKAGLKQLRIAETEKYAHVTYFFNGGEENAVCWRGTHFGSVAQGGHL